MEATNKEKSEDLAPKESSEIQIGERTYQIAPPSVFTIIEFSELVAKLPQVELNIENGTSESLMIARHCRVLGDMVAVLVYGGGRECKEQKTVSVKRFSWSKPKTITVEVDAKAELAKNALRLGPNKLNDMIIELLSRQELSAFFSLTSSLIEVNVTRPTKE